MVKFVLLILLFFFLFIASCDSYENDLTVHNQTSERIYFQMINDLGFVVGISVHGSRAAAAKELEIKPAEIAVISINQTNGTRSYELQVRNENGHNFSKTLNRKALDDKKWKIVISENGID